MSRPRLSGVSVDRLTAICRQHDCTMEAGERMAILPLANDPTLDAAELTAVLRWRALGSLRAACGNDAAVLRSFLREAELLQRRGQI